ncbi:MAG TPA: sugar phosphate isomerase/epimerase family protein [Acidobacteriaceae bacterium]|jgi:sugar phosphate isomerase/epimerase|nr:sugar phosphate isomerase/epimerase family protein [Acidobacteriaceae bacterium]
MSLLERLSLNQITTEPWSLEQTVAGCERNGISYIGAWRHKLEGDAVKAAAIIHGAGLHVSSLCRGGWFSAPTAEARRERIADSRRAVEEAAALAAPVLVMVAGPANGQTLDDARKTVLDGMAEILPVAEKVGVVVGIEPLHPMYAAERSVVVTLKQANDMAEQCNHPAVGVVVDVFHLWWDPEVFHEIERAKGRIVGFHVSDWPVPLPGILMGRAIMGDGVIEIRRLRQAVEAAGYAGPIEVEIFNDDVWKHVGDGMIETIKQRFVEHV